MGVETDAGMSQPARAVPTVGWGVFMERKTTGHPGVSKGQWWAGTVTGFLACAKARCVPRVFVFCRAGMLLGGSGD